MCVGVCVRVCEWLHVLYEEDQRAEERMNEQFGGGEEGGGEKKCHSRGGGVRITSIKITDQISIELKQTRTREGHYIMCCVDFFFPY